MNAVFIGIGHRHAAVLLFVALTIATSQAAAGVGQPASSPSGSVLVEIDARAFGPGTVDVLPAGVFGLDRAAVQTLPLSPGRYDLSISRAGPPASVPFTVERTGTVAVAASLSGCVGGQGTTRLTVACDPRGLPVRAYVPLTGEDAIAVLSEATQAVIARIPAGGRPFGVALHPDRSRVWVTVSTGAEADGFVLAIETATNTVMDTRPVGRQPAGIAVNSSGTRIYVANFGSSSVSVLDAATGVGIATVDVGGFPSVSRSAETRRACS